MSNTKFNEKECAMDALYSQKFIASNYNISLLEASTSEVRHCFEGILAEEYKIQEELFSEMSNRGWYPTEKAEEQKVTKARQQFGTTVTA